MESYIRDELPDLVAKHFPLDMSRQGIFGHSMGGHGAITLALKNPQRYALGLRLRADHPAFDGGLVAPGLREVSRSGRGDLARL